jgi:endonuclease/exonuclease/phosphatase family metal-dependent hydrolase
MMSLGILKRACSALALFTFVAVSAQVPAFAASPAARTGDGSEVQLLSFNGRVEYAPGAWNRRKAAIARVLNESRFDVIAIQEASELMIADYQAALPNDYYVVGERSDGHRGDQRWYEFNPIFYNPVRFEKLDAGSIWVGENPSKPGDTLRDSKWHGRVFNWLVLRERATGRRLAIGDVHIHGQQGDRAVGLIAKTIRDHANGAPIVLLGDFNSNPTTAAYRRLTDPHDLNFVDAMSGARERSGGDATILSPGQFVPKPKTADGLEEGKAAERIDYVFADHALRLESYRIVDSRIEGQTFASDHFPIAVTLSLPAERASAR